MWTALTLATVLATAPGERTLVDRIAAVVNDDVVTISELNQAAEPYFTADDTPQRRTGVLKNTLDQLISERLLEQQLETAQIEVTDNDVEAAIKDILKQNKLTEDQLRQAVESRNMSMGQYRENVKTQLIRLKLIDLKVRSRVNIPESDVREEYERRTRNEPAEERVHIRHIFLRWGDNPNPEERKRVLENAQAIQKRVSTEGVDFQAVAKEMSDGPTAAQGGDLGELTKSGLLPELAKGLEGVEPGQITSPIETPNGVHIVLLESRTFEKATTYELVRTQIYSELYQARQEEQMKIWLDEIRAASAIEIRLEEK